MCKMCHYINNDPDNVPTVYTWYDDYCFTCGKAVQRDNHKVAEHRLLSGLDNESKIKKAIARLFGKLGLRP